MSVSNELGRVVSVATASQTAFPFTNIAVFTGSDLLVFQNGTQLTMGTHYTVALSGTAPSDGTVTLVTGAEADDVIIIERNIPRQQNTVYNPGTAFSAKSHENALDRNILVSTDLHTRVNYIPQFDRGYQANYSWRYTNLPDAETPKIPIYDPVTKTISWGDADSGIDTLDFSALTGSLDISGADSRIEDITKDFSGAVARELGDILSDWKSVKDFGATGDGVTDDTSAINAALDTGGEIFFPAGDYLISGQLTPPSNTTIRGAGVGATRIFSETDHSFFTGTNVVDIEISHMSLEGIHPGGTGSNTVFDAINFFGSTLTQRGYRFHHLDIKNFTGRAIVLVRHVADVFVHDNLVDNCLIGVFLFGGNARTVTHDNVLRNCRVAGIFIDDATNGGVAGVDAFQPFFHTVTGNLVIHAGHDPVQTGIGIGVSASSGVVVADNVVDSTGDPGTVASVGIIVNSGQDDLFAMQGVTVTGNVVRFGSSYGIYLEAAARFVVSSNVLVNNHNWTSAVSNGAEIILRSHGTTATPTQVGLVTDNVMFNTGATDARATIGIDLFDTTLGVVHLGANVSQGLTNPYRSLVDAGDVFWRSIDPAATIPTHDDGFKGRVIYDTARQLLVQSNGSQWSPVAPLAWCMFDGTDSDPITIDSGHNVTNVTKSATGVYVVNLSETMSNATYAAVASSSVAQTRVGTCTTTTVAITTEDDAGNDADAVRISLVLFGTAS